MDEEEELDNYFFNFVNIRYIFYKLIYFLFNRQIKQDFLQLKKIKIKETKLRKKLSILFGFLQVTQKKEFVLPQLKYKKNKIERYKKIFITFYKFYDINVYFIYKNDVKNNRKDKINKKKKKDG